MNISGSVSIIGFVIGQLLFLLWLKRHDLFRKKVKHIHDFHVKDTIFDGDNEYVFSKCWTCGMDHVNVNKNNK